MHLRDWKWAWQPKYFPARSVHHLLKSLSKFLNLPLMHHHSIELQCLLQWHGGLCQSVATPHNVVGLLWLHYPLQCYWKNIGIVYLEPLLKSHLPSLWTKLLIFSSCVNLLNRSTYSSVDDRTCKLHVYTCKSLKKCRSSEGEYKMPPDSLLSEMKVQLSLMHWASIAPVDKCWTYIEYVKFG